MLGFLGRWWRHRRAGGSWKNSATLKKRTLERQAKAAPSQSSEAYLREQRPVVSPAAKVHRKVKDAGEVEGPFMVGVKVAFARTLDRPSYALSNHITSLLQSIDSYAAFPKLLEDQDAQVRIYGLDILGRCGHWLGREGLAKMRHRVRILTGDTAGTESTYAFRQSDEDEPQRTVASAAAHALVALDHAWHTRVRGDKSNVAKEG